MSRPQPGAERGQSTVEFALVLPLVVVVVLGVLQLGMIIYLQVGVTHAAREVARALSVDPTADVGALVQQLTTVGGDATNVSTNFEESPGGARRYVVVRVSTEVPAVSVLFSALVDNFAVSAEAMVLVEST